MAIITTLVLGMVMSTSGVGLAISGGSDSGSAAGRQYQQENQGTEQVAASSSDDTPKAPKQSTPAASASKQAVVIESGNRSSLPFTGYSAIPVLLGGLALLALGLVMRRQARRE